MTFTVLNPATEEPIAELEQAGVEEADAAVARAKAAFPAWRAVAPADRARLLRRLATLVEENAEELATDRVAERRQADRRRARRDRDGRAGVPLLRRRDRQAPRRDDSRRRRRRSDVSRAARRRRSHRAVELPGEHRQLEARPGARVRQYGRPQAGRADAALGDAARRAVPRGRDSGGCRERPRRARAPSSGSA